MRIGDTEWQWVSLDSAGVPHGGPYGNVEWFAEQVRKIGLDLAWSRMYRAFFLYRKRRDGYCEPMLACVNWTTPPEPIPLSLGFLNYLRAEQHWFGFQTAAILQERQAQGDRDREHQAHKYRAELLINAREDIMKEAAHKVGARTRPLISIPSRRLMGMN